MKKITALFFLCTFVSSGCSSVPQSVFSHGTGSYFPMQGYAPGEAPAEDLTSKYNAIVRMTPAPRSGVDHIIGHGPSEFDRKILSEMQAILDSPKVWLIVAAPENADYVLFLLRNLPSRPVPTNAQLRFEGISPEPFLSEMRRLRLTEAPPR